MTRILQRLLGVLLLAAIVVVGVFLVLFSLASWVFRLSNALQAAELSVFTVGYVSVSVLTVWQGRKAWRTARGRKWLLGTVVLGPATLIALSALVQMVAPERRVLALDDGRFTSSFGRVTRDNQYGPTISLSGVDWTAPNDSCAELNLYRYDTPYSYAGFRPPYGRLSVGGHLICDRSDLLTFVGAVDTPDTAIAVAAAQLLYATDQRGARAVDDGWEATIIVEPFFGCHAVGQRLELIVKVREDASISVVQYKEWFPMWAAVW